MSNIKFDPYDFSEKNIEGVPVYYKNLPWAPCVFIHLVFSVGAFNDPVGLEGLAHFLEHMIGAGCPSLPNKKAIKEFNRLYMLNSRNAYTSNYSTRYVCKCLPQNYEKVVSAFMEQVFQPMLREEDTINEEKIITQESWGRFKNEKFLNYTKEMIQNVYPGNQRSRTASPLGWPDTIKKITDADLKKFHKENYTKNNFSVFLVGAVEDKHLEILPELLKNLPVAEKAVVDEGQIGKPLKNRVEKFGDEIGDPTEQLEFTLNRFMERLTEEERFIGNISVSLVFDILFERLRTEHSLCYGVKTPYSAYKNSTEVSVSVQTSKDKLELVEKEIWSVFDEIIKGDWKERFNVVKNLSIEKLESTELLSSDVISYATANNISLGKITTLEKILSEYSKITYEDVVDFIKKTFDKNYILTEVIYPNKN